MTLAAKIFSLLMPIPTYSVFVFFACNGNNFLFSSFKTVNAFLASISLSALVDAFKSAAIFVVSIGCKFERPKLYLARNTFFTLSLRSSQLSFPAAMASFTFSILPSISPGKHSISLPAIKDITEASPLGKNLLTPFISSASVNVMPLYPSSLRNKFCTAIADSDVGKLVVVSNAGIERCAIITLPTPAFIISLKGYNSRESSDPFDFKMMGKS